MRLSILLLAAALLLAACGADEAGGPAETEPPVDGPPVDAPAGEQGDAINIEGVLAGDPDLEGGCVWLEADAGNYEVVEWPEGYQAQADPVQLLGPDGEVVAEEGALLRLDGRVAEDMMSICQVGTLFQATAVEIVE
jgi:hypothetical protein